MNTQLLIIDPQNDFMDIPQSVSNGMQFSPTLPVPGAWEDSKRLSKFIDKAGNHISGITMTMDSHQLYDVGHPLFWRDSKGESPAPFTPISAEDIRNRVWVPRESSKYDQMLDYAETLESEGLFSVFIWPEHCIVGTQGWNVVKPIMDSVLNWERKFVAKSNFATKGSSPYTEHYGGFRAQVPLANDPTTQLNIPLIEKFNSSDLILFSGQALSHCVATTVRQLADNFGDDNLNKLVFLEDTSSPVDGFQKDADDFVREMKSRGMRCAKTSDITFTRDGINIPKEA